MTEKTLKTPIFKWGSFLIFVVSFSVFLFQNQKIEVYVTSEIPEHNFTISMPRKDKQKLESFLRHYCILDEWLYTLIGVKPVSFSPCNKQASLWGILRYKGKQMTGWETWAKYSHYFQSSRFAVFTDKSVVSDEWFFLVIVDRLQFEQIVHKYANDFQSVLQLENLNSSKLLERSAAESFFNDILQGHDGLIGTVLGYGKDNAWLYFNGSHENETELSFLWDERLMNKMLDHWNKKPSYKHWDLSHLFYPSCVAISDSEESVALRNLYIKAREKILQYYEGKDFVEATLSLMNQRNTRVAAD